MRIVHLLDCTGHGGDALAALLLAQAQIAAGHEPVILIEAGDHSQEFIARADASGVFAVEMSSLIHDGHQPARLRFSELRRVLKPHARAVLHVHVGGLLVRSPDVAAIRAVRFARRVATVQAPFGWDRYPSVERYQREWRWASRLLDAVVTPSLVARTTQLEAGLDAKRMHVVGNPIDISSIEGGDGGRVRAELGLGDEVVVLFLARMDADKRPVAAVEALAASGANATLLLAGRGSEQERVRAVAAGLGIGDRVRVLGHRSDTADLLAAADVFVQPSIHESFGMSALEGMAAGLATITTDVGVIPELPADAVQHVPIDDTAALAEAIRELCHDEARRRALAVRGRGAAGRFDRAVIERAYGDIYRGASGRRLG